MHNNRKSYANKLLDNSYCLYIMDGIPNKQPIGGTYTMRHFDKDSNTRTRIFGKRDFQRVLKELKQQGATVEKNEVGGYDVLFGGDMIMQAMNGTNSYLVRIDSDSLSEA